MLDSEVTRWSGAYRSPERSTAVAVLGRAGCRRLPSTPRPAQPELLDLGCSSSPALGHAWLWQGHPASSLGCSHLAVSSAQEPTGAMPWSLNTSYLLSTGIYPLFYFVTEGEEHVPHLVGFFYASNLTKGFGPFIEAEVHGYRRKGRKQLTKIQFLEIHPIDEVIRLFRCNGSSFFKLLSH